MRSILAERSFWYLSLMHLLHVLSDKQAELLSTGMSLQPSTNSYVFLKQFYLTHSDILNLLNLEAYCRYDKSNTGGSGAEGAECTTMQSNSIAARPSANHYANS